MVKKVKKPDHYPYNVVKPIETKPVSCWVVEFDDEDKPSLLLVCDKEMTVQTVVRIVQVREKGFRVRRVDAGWYQIGKIDHAYSGDARCLTDKLQVEM